VTALAFDLFAGVRGWEAALDEGELDTIGFEWDSDACATARAVGLHTVQDDVARLVPATMALVYGQPEGMICSPPCQLFSAAGKGAGRQLMEELHRAVRDAADGASDIVMARHRRELRRLLYRYLRESQGYKRSRGSRHRRPDGKSYNAEATSIRRDELRAEADRLARNVSLVWQPARWVAALKPRWVALARLPAVLPLWEEMARGLTAWVPLLDGHFEQ
jgi:site-specific DNA-cytosine methylase